MKKNLLIATTVLVLTSMSALVAKDLAKGKANWISPDPRLRLDQIHFLGSHNAFLNKKDGWLYAQQRWPVKKQLDAGVRVIELDLGNDGGKLFLCHGECKSAESKVIKTGSFRSFKEAMNLITDWLKEHPQEVILIALDNKRDPHMKPNQVDSELAKMTDITPMILKPSDWNPEELNGDWPTLQWMRDHKKQIVIFNPKPGDSPRHTYYQWRYVAGTTPGTTEPQATAKLRGESASAFTAAQAAERQQIQRFFQINHDNAISEKYAKKAFDAGAKLGIAGDKKKVKKIQSKSKLSDNKRSTIQAVVDASKAKGLVGGKNPNILLFDWTEKYIADNGLDQINAWNQQEAALINDAAFSGNIIH